MIKYAAQIVYDKEDNCYNVSFPDLKGCFTYGETMEEAQHNAKEALSGYLESLDMRKIKIPVPSKHNGKTLYYIKPEKNVSFAIWLKLKRQEKGYTQKDMANILNIKYQTYQRFENTQQSNPTLKTITKIENVINEEIIRV
ncbi:MAG TPA: type II toxin-antitoxin system HicB family antitoxin [Spirochaetota bacterium]|nr:type II toxin-antitoxin system HicB family antitoxin [Spirochaetota bacterium]